MSQCFILGRMKGLTFTQFQTYSSAVGIFNRVQRYNANISTLRGQGDLTQRYYTFQSNEEESMYTMGRFLLVQNDPLNAQNYLPVSQN